MVKTRFNLFTIVARSALGLGFTDGQLTQPQYYQIGLFTVRVSLRSRQVVRH